MNEKHQLKILLVDDSEDNRILIKSYLKMNNYQITEADNGLLAIENAKSVKFDIILMDIQMPTIDGLEATVEIRKWEALNNIPHTPIIALTAYMLDDDIENFYAIGCTAYLSKPFKKMALLDLMEKILIDKSLK